MTAVTPKTMSVVSTTAAHATITECSRLPGADDSRSSALSQDLAGPGSCVRARAM